MIFIVFLLRVCSGRLIPAEIVLVGLLLPTLADLFSEAKFLRTHEGLLLDEIIIDRLLFIPRLQEFNLVHTLDLTLGYFSKWHIGLPLRFYQQVIEAAELVCIFYFLPCIQNESGLVSGFVSIFI